MAGRTCSNDGLVMTGASRERTTGHRSRERPKVWRPHFGAELEQDMTTATRTRKPPIVAADRAHPEHPARLDGRLTTAMTFARARVRRLIEWLPGTWKATMAGANDTTSELQRLPDSTLQLLAVGSFGLGAGFYFSGAPRVIVAAGFTPALVMGAAIFLRPIMPARGRQALREVEA